MRDVIAGARQQLSHAAWRGLVTVILWLLLLSVGLGGSALALFLWSLRSGQYDDIAGAAERVLFDD